MKKKIFKTNKEYLEFFTKYKEQLIIYQLNFTKTMQIRLFYDIM